MEVTNSVLSKVSLPSDLRRFNIKELEQLCKEIRDQIIDVTSNNCSGHLGASIGVVELTTALHYVFNAPEDKIIWDTGHQAYPHKILTGRKDIFDTNRKYGGISGFPKMSESKYDAFGVGHSSTSISAALGIAVADNKFLKKDNQVVAVIGDGALTSGLAFEGLNNAGIEKTNLLVILNDNNMAIDPNVGALNQYLLKISTSKSYNQFKSYLWNWLGRKKTFGPKARKIFQIIENGIKAILLHHSNFFESLNFRYFGPVDGHNLKRLIKILEDLKKIPGPKVLHCITVKGKGYTPAEKNQTVFHAPGRFDKKTGEIIAVKDDKQGPPKYQDVFGHTMVELAKLNEKIIGITPAMPTGCSLNIMMKHFPERTFDVGIAEQHAVTFSAGLASQGLLPYCNIYSSFMQRAFDQVIHDVALQNLKVIFCLDRAGIVGDDGPTHHGSFDISYMRLIPNIIIASPMDEIELRNMMYTAQLETVDAPMVIRYPRGAGVHKEWRAPLREISIGTGRVIREGCDIAVLTIGHTGNFISEIIPDLTADKIDVAHYDMRFAKPLDEEMLHQIFMKFKNIITVEDGSIIGGFGSAILEFMNEHKYNAHVKILGIGDKFIEHGTQQELYKDCGFDTQSIYNTIKKEVKTSIFNTIVQN